MVMAKHLSLYLHLKNNSQHINEDLLYLSFQQKVQDDHMGWLMEL